MPRLWDRLDERVQENATGILGTIAFHMVLILIFLIIKISTEKSRLENLIVVDFDEEQPEEQMETMEPDPEFAERLARYLEEPRSNVPVNLARQIDQELSTEDYVRELEKDLDASKPESWKEMQERLKELEELDKEELSMESEDPDQKEAEPYEGPTNIYYELEYRYHLRLPVPVYKCEGAGVIEVRIVVDQRGRVVQAEIEKTKEKENDICLAEAARNAALKTRFNADYDAPVRQVGKLIYHFIAQ
ncbi:MAG: hypothetical protein KAT15_26230 [Bacteroidales bacterium]|nr:hypothetical protein [Bacteroidales bacterium]